MLSWNLFSQLIYCCHTQFPIFSVCLHIGPIKCSFHHSFPLSFLKEKEEEALFDFFHLAAFNAGRMRGTRRHAMTPWGADPITSSLLIFSVTPSLSPPASCTFLVATLWRLIEVQNHERVFNSLWVWEIHIDEAAWLHAYCKPSLQLVSPLLELSELPAPFKGIVKVFPSQQHHHHHHLGVSSQCYWPKTGDCRLQLSFIAIPSLGWSICIYKCICICICWGILMQFLCAFLCTVIGCLPGTHTPRLDVKIISIVIHVMHIILIVQVEPCCLLSYIIYYIQYLPYLTNFFY